MSSGQVGALVIRHDAVRRWLLAALVRALGRRLPLAGDPAPLEPARLALIVDQVLDRLASRGADELSTAQLRRERLGEYLLSLSSQPELRAVQNELRGVIEDLALPTLWPLLEPALPRSGDANISADALPLPLLGEIARHFPAAQAGDHDAANRVRELLDEIDANLPAPGQAQEPGPRADVSTGALRERLADQPSTRREIVERAKQLVGEQLQLRTVGRELPEAVLLLLEVGWGPVLAMRLVRHGTQSAAWQEGLRLTDEVVNLFGRGSRAHSDNRERAALLTRVEAELKRSGMHDDRRRSLLEPLRSSLQQDDSSHALAEPTPQQRQLLRQIAGPGSWFRLNRRKGGGASGWLQVLSHDVPAGLVEFTSFDGKSTVTLEVRQLLDDLVRNRTEALEPSTPAATALQQLRDGRLR